MCKLSDCGVLEGSDHEGAGVLCFARERCAVCSGLEVLACDGMCLLHVKASFT